MSTGVFSAVAIGASAGALEALSKILPPLPADYPLAVLVVVHLPPDKDSLLASILGEKCAMAVKEAEDKESIEPGTIYIAPPGYHLLVEKDGTLSLSSEEEVLFSRPSIDVLFESAADAFGGELIGIVLTGANSDGAAGLQAIGRAGGTAFAQDPLQAFASTMPRAALEACPTACSLKLADIAMQLLSLPTQGELL